MKKHQIGTIACAQCAFYKVFKPTLAHPVCFHPSNVELKQVREQEDINPTIDFRLQPYRKNRYGDCVDFLPREIGDPDEVEYPEPIDPDRPDDRITKVRTGYGDKTIGDEVVFIAGSMTHAKRIDSIVITERYGKWWVDQLDGFGTLLHSIPLEEVTEIYWNFQRSLELLGGGK